MAARNTYHGQATKKAVANGHWVDSQGRMRRPVSGNIAKSDSGVTLVNRGGTVKKAK